MIRNRNIQTGLLVFFITLAGLFTVVTFYPENNVDNENQTITKDVIEQEKLEIASK